MSTIETPAPAGWDPTLAKIAAHPMRLSILRAIARHGEASPSTIADELEERLGNVSYHVRTLFDRGMLELRRTEPRRGAVEHFYAVTKKAAALLPDDGHRVEITFEAGFGARARLICPETGCEHPVDEGVVDESIPCWVQTWFEGLGADDLLEGTIVVPVTSITADGDDGVIIGVGAGERSRTAAS